MTISTTKGKAEAIVLKIRELFENKYQKFWELATVIDSTISLFPAIPFAKLHCRALEKNITIVFKAIFCHMQILQISYKVTALLYWWLK